MVAQPGALLKDKVRRLVTFKRIELEDMKAISRVHRDACLLAYQFMDWSYPLQEVEDWYSQKFAGWTWTLAAICPESRMVGFIAMIGTHIDQLFCHRGQPCSHSTIS